MEWKLKHLLSTITQTSTERTTNSHLKPFNTMDRRGRARTVVGFTTTYANSTYHQHRCEFESRSAEVYSIQHYVIKFVIDLW